MTDREHFTSESIQSFVRVADGATYSIGLMGSIVISAWTLGTEHSVAEFKAVVDKLISPRGAARAIVVIHLLPGTSVPEGHVREVLVAMLKEHEHRMAFVLLAEESGFRSAAMRAAAATLRLLSGGGIPLDYTTNLADATRAIEARGQALGIAVPEPAKLEVALSALRADVAETAGQGGGNDEHSL